MITARAVLFDVAEPITLNFLLETASLAPPVFPPPSYPVTEQKAVASLNLKLAV